MREKGKSSRLTLRWYQATEFWFHTMLYDSYGVISRMKPVLSNYLNIVCQSLAQSRWKGQFGEDQLTATCVNEFCTAKRQLYGLKMNTLVCVCVLSWLYCIPMKENRFTGDTNAVWKLHTSVAGANSWTSLADDGNIGWHNTIVTYDINMEFIAEWMFAIAKRMIWISWTMIGMSRFLSSYLSFLH